MIRRADVHDVPAIGKIVNDCAEYGQMLHRSMSFLYEHVRDFFVAIEQDNVIATCGLGVVWADLAEIYALAVSPAHRRQGQGEGLVSACIDEAKTLGIRRVIALTYEQQFFARQGFAILDRQKLPLKIWSQCLACPKNQACDEIAMMRELTDVPEVKAPVAEAPSADAYIVPVPLRIGQDTDRQNNDQP